MHTKKRILLCDWQSQSQPDLQEGLESMPDCMVIPFAQPLNDYDKDTDFQKALECQIRQENINICFTFNYFPVISRVCHKMDILYVSWIYDCPHTTLYSKTIYHDCNLIFTFDYLQMEEFRGMGVEHIFHMPLAVNTSHVSKLLASNDLDQSKMKYFSEISFVGSIYDDNYYEQIAYLPEKLKGYIDGICMAQLQVPEVDLLENLLEDSVVAELKKYVKLSLDDNYEITYQKLFCDLFLKKYISSLERKEMLTALSSRFDTTLYSGSQWSAEGLDCRGVVSYREQMPQVFYYSLLNLNLSIRSIRSGIPLRCLDIMGAGGALISNVQPELEEYFEEGREWIGFHDKGELIEKATFYLQHDELRRSIAQRGFRKVKEQFTYQCALEKMFRTIETFL